MYISQAVFSNVETLIKHVIRRQNMVFCELIMIFDQK